MLDYIRRFINGATGSGPEFLILGAQKSGTTALYDLLSGISGISPAIIKEPGFFSNDLFFNARQAWYRELFLSARRNELRFEATPEYFYYEFVPKRIYEFNPNIKFILTLRDPAERCFSAWNMFRSFNKNCPDLIYQEFVQYANPEMRSPIKELLYTVNYPSFRQAVLDDIDRLNASSKIGEPSFVRRGLYAKQLTNYLQYFDISNFLILEQRELRNPEEICAKIGEFLGVPIVRNTVAAVESNVGEYEAPTNEELQTLEMLRLFYRPHNEEFFQMIGKRFEWGKA